MILQHLDKYNCEPPKLVEQIRTGLYVDDLITGIDSVESGDYYAKTMSIGMIQLKGMH